MCRPGFIAPEDCAAFSTDCETDDCGRPTAALVMVGNEWQALCAFCGTSVLIRQATGVRAVRG